MESNISYRESRQAIQNPFRENSARAEKSERESSFQNKFSTYLNNRYNELASKLGQEKQREEHSQAGSSKIYIYSNQKAVNGKKSKQAGKLKYILKTEMKNPSAKGLEWFHNCETPIKQTTKVTNQLQDVQGNHSNDILICDEKTSDQVSRTSIKPEKQNKDLAFRESRLCVGAVGSKTTIKSDNKAKLRNPYESCVNLNSEEVDSPEKRELSLDSINKMKEDCYKTVRKMYSAKFSKAIKPVKIPASHGVPFQVFLSTKGLTVGKDPAFKTEERLQLRKKRFQEFNKSYEEEL
eukprot:CAMPEP_0168349892 /NCGR_PEP_ID=MMETSP0213-20121227/20740_1 /TAXON_ID=151035 /ORGANISM="Euplotes harpa, Strain FSP1.4" /LENGTH=293 /DNA_ID=CAMNT_0008360027 /DNA_START=191 /DNA_END=1069 /DNA_ORIENTATION=-